MRSPHAKIIIFAIVVVIGMFGFSFALSPLYTKLCRSVDFYSGRRIWATGEPDFSRSVRVEFVTSNNRNLSWTFYSNISSLNVHPNENVRTVFYAKNNTNKKMTVQAIPSFSPNLAAKHFHKTECFCFSQQTLGPGESKVMPLIFHVDEALPKDIPVITLAYTLFDVTKKDTIHAAN